MKRGLIPVLFAFFIGMTGAPVLGADTAISPATWFQTKGVAVVRSHASQDLPDVQSDKLARISVGEPVNADQFEGKGENTTASDFWVAPISVDGVVIGSLAADFSGDKISSETVNDDVDLGILASNVPDDTTIVVDPKIGAETILGAWFALTDAGLVTPIDSVARSVMAGSVTVTQYASIRGGLIKTDDVAKLKQATAKKKPGDSNNLVWVAIIVASGLLIAAGILVWLRYEHKKNVRAARAAGSGSRAGALSVGSSGAGTDSVAGYLSAGSAGSEDSSGSVGGVSAAGDAVGSEDTIGAAGDAVAGECDNEHSGLKKFLHNVDDVSVFERPQAKEKKNEDTDN